MCWYKWIHPTGGHSFGHSLIIYTTAKEEGSVVDTVDIESEAFDRLISRRASEDRRPDPDERDELWKASVRAYNATRQEERRALWAEYHRRQAESLRRNLASLAAYHEQEARKYLPKGAS